MVSCVIHIYDLTDSSLVTPGHTPCPNPLPHPGHNPRPHPGHTPGHIPGHIPSHTPGHTPGHTSGQTPRPHPLSRPRSDTWATPRQHPWSHPQPYLPLVPFFGILFHFSGISENCPGKAPNFRNFGKTVPKMHQSRSFCGILQFPPKNVPNFPFFPENFPNFTIFVGVFMKFYYFSPQKSL